MVLWKMRSLSNFYYMPYELLKSIIYGKLRWVSIQEVLCFVLQIARTLHCINLAELGEVQVDHHVNERNAKLELTLHAIVGVVNGPLKNEKSQQFLPKSRNLAQPTNGSRSLKFCICRSHICFSIKSINFSISVSDLQMPVSPRQAKVRTLSCWSSLSTFYRGT